MDDNNFKKFIIGGLIAGIVSYASYFFGNYNGFEKGKIKGKEETIELLVDERYDAHQNAKYAGDLERQKEILKNAEAITRTLELLDKNRHLYRDVFPYQNKLKDEE